MSLEDKMFMVQEFERIVRSAEELNLDGMGGDNEWSIGSRSGVKSLAARITEYLDGLRLSIKKSHGELFPNAWQKGIEREMGSRKEES